jgi:hypothetical protein
MIHLKQRFLGQGHMVHHHPSLLLGKKLDDGADY